MGAKDPKKTKGVDNKVVDKGVNHANIDEKTQPAINKLIENIGFKKAVNLILKKMNAGGYKIRIFFNSQNCFV